jgi:hypothetical protein
MILCVILRALGIYFQTKEGEVFINIIEGYSKKVYSII